jgi:Abnormal spindle-like microcephaly-assoc'd, ASPM-SPD-2-Hydin
LTALPGMTSRFALCLVLLFLLVSTSYGASDYLTFSPTSADFGSVVINETKTLEIQMNNVSGKTIQLTSIAVSVDPTEFSETNDCPEEILAGASCTLSVSFHPKSGGGYHGVKKAIFEFYQGTSEIAYLDANGQAL